MASSVTINGSSTTTTETRTLGSITIAGTSSIDYTVTTTLASGDNNFTLPAGAVGVVIQPVGGSWTGSVKFRYGSDSSDAGILLSNTNPCVLTFGASPGSIIINSSVLQSTQIECWFW